jgi:hypothetical protein
VNRLVALSFSDDRKEIEKDSRKRTGDRWFLTNAFAE